MKKKKWNVTLVEIMIVMALIAIISGALIYNLTGSLDRGKQFATEQKIQRIEQTLTLQAIQSGYSLSVIASNAPLCETLLQESGFFPSGADVLVDAWNEPLDVEYDTQNQRLIISSHSI